MARCFVCHKGNITGNRVSHSAIKTKRTFKANLHMLRSKRPDGTLKRTPLCSSCYKKLKKDFLAGKKILVTPVSFELQKKFHKEAEKAE